MATSEADRGVTVVFSCEDMERRWPSHMSLLPKEVRCGICNTYGSKVRSNLRNHMNEHACGLAANDIINPVPRIGKTDGELMFHKMANYAAYSVKNDDKKVKTKDEVSRHYLAEVTFTRDTICGRREIVSVKVLYALSLVVDRYLLRFSLTTFAAIGRGRRKNVESARICAKNDEISLQRSRL